MIGACSVPGMRGRGHFDKGKFMLALRQKGGGERTPPVSAVFLIAFSSKDPYVELAYLGVAYSDPLQ